MYLKKRLRTLLACALLEIGVLAGAPMRPEEVRLLMQQMNQPTLAHVLPSEEDAGDDPLVAGSPHQTVSRDT